MANASERITEFPIVVNSEGNRELTVCTDQQGRHWMLLLRHDGSVCLYYMSPGQATHIVLWDSLDHQLLPPTLKTDRRAFIVARGNTAAGLTDEINRLHELGYEPTGPITIGMAIDSVYLSTTTEYACLMVRPDAPPLDEAVAQAARLPGL